jgi:predicted exporter
MSARSRLIVAVWLAALMVCGAWLHRHLSVTADLSLFLPPSATPTQRILLGQVREGAVSRLMLIALEGEGGPSLARLSRELARRLRAGGLFSYVSNGETAAMRQEWTILFEHRYLLSEATGASRFSAAGLKEALRENLALLASPAGALIRPMLPEDPTGAARNLVGLLSPESAPDTRYGVWFSRHGQRALLIAQTYAPAFDANRQRRAIDAIREAFAQAQPGRARILLSGPGVFSAQTRETVETEAWRLSLLAAILVIAILVAAHRSAGAVAASLLPVISGLIIGVTAVSVGFERVHGITLGFGATLIGEAVDYPSYLFTQAARGEPLTATLSRIGPTLRLAILTSVFGALAMALSSFEGLAQLGILTIAGVVAAGLTTRWVLPALVPPRLLPARAYVPWFPDPANRTEARRRAYGLAAALTLAALAVLVWRHDRLWDDDLANLTPVPETAKTLDRALRDELGAPEVRYILIARGASREEALQASEAAAAWLRQAVARGWLAGFDVPSSYLPSLQTQETRRAALPDAATLARNLEEAVADSPFREGSFAPFLAAIQRTRAGGVLDPRDFAGTALALKLGALLFHNEDGWTALATLNGVKAPDALSRGARQSGHEFLDLKAESERLVSGYRSESLRLVALGLACIAGLLVVGLHSIARAARVLAPALAAVLIDAAFLLLVGKALSLFNLVAFLLVVGMGLNYALFFERPQRDAAERARTRISLMVCGATTVSAFGCLALSQTPVLHAIGVTVAVGSVLSFLLAAALAGRPGPPG